MIHFALWSPQPAIVQCRKGFQGTLFSYLLAHLYILRTGVGAGFDDHLQGEMALDDCHLMILGILPVHQEF